MELKKDTYQYGRNKNVTMLNEITLNKKMINPALSTDLQFHENDFVYLNSSNGTTLCVITYKTFNEEQHAFLANALSAIHNHQETLSIEKRHAVHVSSYLIAKLDHVKSDKVGISSALVTQLTKGSDFDLKGISIVNRLNGNQLTLDMSQVLIHPDHDVKVWLGVKHRRLLDVELPTFISQYYLEAYPALTELYPSEEHNLTADHYYEQSSLFKSLCKKSNLDLMSIYPIFNEHKKRSLSKRFKNLLDKTKNNLLCSLIGQNQLNLKVIRPYPIDESDNSVRLSATSLKLLGLEDTDTIIIRNGSHVCKARVLPFDDWSVIHTENRIKSEQELNLMIGIPAYMRRELGLPYIHGNVFIERDLAYFFRKNLNKQVMTIVGLLIALPGIHSWPIYYQIPAFSILTILLIYISFSEIREKISNR